MLLILIVHIGLKITLNIPSKHLTKYPKLKENVRKILEKYFEMRIWNDFLGATLGILLPLALFNFEYQAINISLSKI